MPDDATIPHAGELLSSQLLDQATADTKREWGAQALCTASDPEIFFPPSDSPATEARQICAQCPVRGRCLAYAVAADERFGIWGGLNPQERRNLRRQLQRRNTAAATATRRTA